MRGFAVYDAMDMSAQKQTMNKTEGQNGKMQRVCFLLRVKSNRLTEYKSAHQNVWPEMRAALSQHGWTNYSLFLKSDGLLVGYVETPDFKKAVDGMQTEDVNTRWQAAMKDFFTSLGSGAADTSLEVLDEVFHLD
jgi:L-rhamnose mutarotase